MIITSAANARYARLQPGRALLYACGTNMPSDATSAGCGVSHSAALANNWILKDASGNPVHYKGTSAVLTDIGNSAYQQRFISDIDADLRTHPGIDGVFIDDVTGSQIGGGTPVSPEYPDNASYRAAMLSFVKAVGPALKARGWYVSVNASILDGAIESTTGTAWDGSQFIWWVNQISPYVDGIAMEHWQQNWDSSDSVRTTGSTGSTAWDGWQRIVSAVQANGKDFFPIGWGPLSNTTRSAYLKGSFLLDWNGGQGAFSYADSYSGSGDPWNPAWTTDIGTPNGAKFQVGVGWRRNYTGGTVVVNPSPSSSQTFSLGASYLTQSSTSASAVTLSPATAMILPSTSTPTTTTTTPTTTTSPTTTTTTTTATTTTTTTTPSTTTMSSNPTPRPGWTFCTWENGHCSFSGSMEVSYGANGTFTSPRTFTGGVDCNNSVFGDPLVGVVKWCEMRPVTVSVPANTQLPAITGNALVNQVLSASQGTWNGSPTSFTYAWSRCDPNKTNCQRITGATLPTYLVTSDDVGHRLIITVVAGNSGGSAFANSLPTEVAKK